MRNPVLATADWATGHLLGEAYVPIVSLLADELLCSVYSIDSEMQSELYSFRTLVGGGLLISATDHSFIFPDNVYL